VLIKIAWKNLIDKKLNSFLCVLLMALGIGLISLLVILSRQFEEKFTKNISGIDMVVGAKGSPLQLILSSVYQVDNPTGNIPLNQVNALKRNPLVKEVIPMSMGDNYKGYRIVGTNEKYLKHFKTEFAEGKLFAEDLEVVIGAVAAENLGLKIGDDFHSAHGLDSEGETHDHEHFEVVGILEFNNSVVDNLILTSLSSVWAVHEHGEQETSNDQLPMTNTQVDDEGLTEQEPQTSNFKLETQNREITSALVKFRSPMGMMTIPRNINENSVMQAALPSIEVNRLFELLGVGVSTLRALALAIMLISGISVFVSLYNSLKERRYEMALMLSMGASRVQLFGMLLLEGLFLGVVGYVIGLLISRLGIWLVSKQVAESYHFDISQVSFQPEEGWLFLAAIGIGLLAAAIPSLGVYRLNISETLADD
jgi:putative ABC transport system permease protein